MDNDSPATKQDVVQLRGEMGEMETRIRADMGEMETRITDRMTELARDIETKLLTAFHGYGKGVSNRLHDYEISKRTLEDRVAILEDRVLNIETGQGPGQH